MSDHVDEINVHAGTIIHIKGMPFRLKRDAVVMGNLANFAYSVGVTGVKAQQSLPPDNDGRAMQTDSETVNAQYAAQELARSKGKT